MKGLGETSPFHRFTYPQRDKLVYFWSRGSYLLFIIISQGVFTKCIDYNTKCIGYTSKCIVPISSHIRWTPIHIVLQSLETLTISYSNGLR